MTAKIASVVLVVVLGVSSMAAAQEAQSAAILTTAHFAFYSDLPTNVHDALVAASSARLSRQPEPFASGAERACLDALPAAERERWERAVTYYAENKSTGFQRVLLRFKLAGLPQRNGMDDAANLNFLQDVAAIREAATPAYMKCRWPAQDALNREWIAHVAPLLEAHETSLGEQLPSLFQNPWASLPFRVDLVQTAGFSGANSASTDAPTLHIYISSTNPSNQERAALEVVFHEAVHFLTVPDSPLSTAIASAIKASGIAPPRMDLVHAAHFFITGEAVRRALAQAGGPRYTMYLSARKLFSDRYRESAPPIWTAYIDGGLTLTQAAADQVRALAP